MDDDESEPSTPWPEKAISRKAVDGLFKEMALSYGKKFKDQWGGVSQEDWKQHWGKRLYGLSEIEFRRGVAKLKSFDWPPTLPEFLKACRPEVNALNAYYEALEGCRRREQGEVGTWSHPAIFWAAVRVSTHDLKNQTYSQIRQRWEGALAVELAKDQWDVIPAPMVALPAPGKDKISKEDAAKMLEAIKATTTKLTGSCMVDPKRWARVILEREKAGDRTLLPIQKQFAREALNKFKDDESD